MKKTININIAGQLFRIDEDAWEILKRYLDHVSARFSKEQGGDETIEDIEARIAEIFGGGTEPPVMISKEMVNDMINTMGAPEDYYDETASAGNRMVYTRKSMYDPNSLSARIGRALSEFFKTLGKILSAIIRVITVIIGVFFTIIGFTLLFASVLAIFFNNYPFMSAAFEPNMTNIPTLLSIALNSNIVWVILTLTALVVCIPLIALTYLGIKMIFRIRERYRITGIITFVIWIAAVCVLGVILGLQLSVYSNRETSEKKVNLESPPATLWIASMRKSTDISYNETAKVDHFILYRNSIDGRISATPDLNIYGSDTTTGLISVERKANSKSDSDAWSNARSIEYNWRLSGDTLYLDEFFSLPAGSFWNGATVDIDVSLPEDTKIKCVPGTSLSAFRLRVHDPEVTEWQIKGGSLRKIDDN
jgi:hypothetical protein